MPQSHLFEVKQIEECRALLWPMDCEMQIATCLSAMQLVGLTLPTCWNQWQATQNSTLYGRICKSCWASKSKRKTKRLRTQRKLKVGGIKNRVYDPFLFAHIFWCRHPFWLSIALHIFLTSALQWMFTLVLRFMFGTPVARLWLSHSSGNLLT